MNQDSGFELGPQHFAVRYTRRPQLNDIPSPQAATTSTILHSGLMARLRLARTMCTPMAAVKDAESAFKRRYVQAGHDQHTVNEAYKDAADVLPTCLCLAVLVHRSSQL